MLSNLYSGKWLDNMNKMEKIYIGVYFADENVKEKFLEASKCRLGKTDSYNEKGRLFTYTTEDGKDTYYFYEFPLAQENDFSPSKLETILFVLDDGWVDFDYMFAGPDQLYSAGCDLNFDLNSLLWLGWPCSVGVTYSYNGGPSFNSLSESSGIYLGHHYVGPTFNVSF